MSNVVILKNTGSPVKLTDDFSLVEIDNKGFLLGFTYDNIPYRFHTSGDFREKDKKKLIIAEYFNETIFLKYIQFSGAYTPTFENLIQSKFQFESFLSPENEFVEVEMLDNGIPFNFYYKQKIYSFPVEYESGVPKKYKLPLEDKIIPPLTAQVTAINVDRNTNPRGYFYKKNLGNIISSWTITDNEKEDFSEAVTLSAFTINVIVDDIFSKMLEPDDLIQVDAVADRLDPDISDLSPIKRVIFLMKKQWGYYYNPAPNQPIHRFDFDPVLPQTPNYKAFLSYYTSLSLFYHQSYIIKDTFLSKTETERLRYLITLLPYAAIGALPFDFRVDILRALMKESMPENVESYALRIIYSFAESEADAFLDFLLESQDENVTNFEKLYEKMDDKRLSRYPFVTYFVSESPNRQYFTYAVYELWKKSRYNSTFIPSGTIPDADGLNPNAFFINDNLGAHYYENADCVLEYTVDERSNVIGNYEDGLLGSSITTKTSFDGKFQKHLIAIEKTTRRIFKRFNGGEVYTAGDTSTAHFANYHLYQGISIIGYTPDVEMKLPEQPIFPAFLFHYIDEFDKLKDFDAGFTLAIDIATEVMIFYFIGGVSILKDLCYLKHVTKIGRAMRNTLPASEVIEVWRGLEAGTETFSLTTSILSSANQYIATSANDPERKEIAERLSRFFLYLTIASASSALFSRVKAASAADDVIDSIDALPINVPHNLHPQVIALLYSVKNGRVVRLSLFRNYLNNLPLPEVNRIVGRYDLFTADEQIDFWKALGGLKAEDPMWNQLNREYSKIVNSNIIDYTPIDIWKSEVVRLLKAKNNFNFILALNRFKYLKYREVRHIRELIDGDKGGHLLEFMSDNINSSAPFKFVPINVNYPTTIPLNMRSQITPINGHFFVENLYRFNANAPDVYQINGLNLSRKPRQFIINPQWSENDLIEEMAFAWANRVEMVRKPQKIKIGPNVHLENVEETLFESRFSDGTKIEIIHRAQDIEPIHGTLVPDHISLFAIQKP